MGMNQPVVGSNGFNSPQFIKIAGDAANGVIVGTPWFPNKEDQKVKDFRKAYVAKYGKEPDQFAALGAAAGVLVGLSFNAIEPTMGVIIGFKGLAVLILGGLGNITGAMVGGFILGVAEIFSVAYGASTFRDAVAFGLIILLLFWRPQGLFGSKDKGGRP